MNSAFSVCADVERGLLFIELGGFFGTADVSRFAAQKHMARAELDSVPGNHVTLVDVTACRIQAQDVYDAFAGLAAGPAERARRLGFITGDSLVRLQVRRLIKDRPNVRCFVDRASAEAWLFADDDMAEPN